MEEAGGPRAIDDRYDGSPACAKDDVYANKRMAGKGKFAAENIHSAKNLVELPNDVHKEVSAFYSSKRPEITGEGFRTVRDWLNTQSFAEQSKFGRRVIDHYLHGKPL